MRLPCWELIKYNLYPPSLFSGINQGRGNIIPPRAAPKECDGGDGGYETSAFPVLAEPQFGSIWVFVLSAALFAELGFRDPRENRSDAVACGLFVVIPCPSSGFIRTTLHYFPLFFEEVSATFILT